jgi:hypothetical protein
MKHLILSVIAAGAVFFGTATEAEAGLRYSSGYRGAGFGYSTGHGYSNHNHCAQPYKVRTVEVGRYHQCRTGYDRCGRLYTYHVTVVTYCDHYSNGATRTWSRTFS